MLAPTTLLSMVDASLGGKTGVNRPRANGGLAKNLVGGFWPARVVVADTDTLETLGEREFRSGLAECIKHGLTLRGIDAGPPRLPLQPLNKDDKRELAEVIRTMNTTIAQITGTSMGEGS